jgi:type VI secretion system secreted protein VgrG
MAEQKSFHIACAIGDAVPIKVASLRLEQKLGMPSEAVVELVFAEYQDLDALLGQPAHIAFGRLEPEQIFDGIVELAEVAATADDHDDDRGMVYRLHIVPMLAPMAQTRDCRIFQDKDVKEIVTEVLESYGVDAEHQKWHLLGSYPKRDYCVQYEESALAFVSRLLEEEGIYYWSDAGDVVVFDDDSTASDAVPGDPVVIFRHGGGMERADDAIAVITERHRTRNGKVVLRDYNFETPSVDMTATAEGDKDTDLELYDHPGFYAEPADGKRLAQVRLEAFTSEIATLELSGGVPRITAGKWFELHDSPNLDGEYFITGAVHTFEHDIYRVTATVIPKEVKFRNRQRIPRPIIEGPQTATIVAPEGSPAEEIHTDEHGRCKVLFHWDRYGKRDDTATFWMRVAQPQTSGSMVLPRVGWEVIVEFLGGNPDRPIITGRVYNGRYMPPYALPEGKSRTSIQTSVSPGGGGTNEIRFEDKAGSEEIMVHAHKDTTLATANNKTKSTAVNETKNVKVDAKLTVGADQTVKVTNGYLNTVDGAQTQTIGGSRKVEVNAVYGLTSKGASSTSVGGGQFEMDGNPIQALLSLAVKAATEAAQAAAAKQLQKLDAAVQSKVDQVMGPINELQGQVRAVGDGMNAVSNGDLGAAAGTFGAAAGLPMPGAFGSSLTPPAGGGGADNGGGGDGGGGDGGAGGGGFSQTVGLDSLVSGAIASAGSKLGEALGAGGGGGGGSSAANVAGPEGAVDGNAAADSATGPGHAVNVCSATHTEKVSSIKASIAAAGIHTTVKAARKQDVGAARVELVAGTRAESCLASKTEKAVGLVVLSKGPEQETVGGSRTTMVGGAILEKVGGSVVLSATGMVTLAGSFCKFDAKTAIVFECGGSSVVIDGSGVTIKSAAVTVTAPKVTFKGSVAQGS